MGLLGVVQAIQQVGGSPLAEDQHFQHVGGGILDQHIQGGPLESLFLLGLEAIEQFHKIVLRNPSKVPRPAHSTEQARSRQVSLARKHHIQQRFREVPLLVAHGHVGEAVAEAIEHHPSRRGQIAPRRHGHLGQFTEKLGAAERAQHLLIDQLRHHRLQRTLRSAPLLRASGIGHGRQHVCKLLGIHHGGDRRGLQAQMRSRTL
jgi:hypothetical protein